MTARRPTNCGTGSSNWQIKTRRGAGMENPVRPEPAASERARLATNRDLPTLGSPPTNRMPCGGNSPGSTRHRSEERRVGKECRSRWLPDFLKKIRIGQVWKRVVAWSVSVRWLYVACGV